MRPQWITRWKSAPRLRQPACLVFAALLGAAGLFAQAPRSIGVITTVAGGGYNGTSSSDGGSATSARAYWPQQMAMDSAGNLYYSDQKYHVVRKVTPGGIISTVAGNWTSGTSGDGGLATAAQLNTPSGLAFDASGNLYISDQYGQNIRKVDATTGIISTFASGSYLADSSPAGLAFDSSGNLWVALDGSGCVLKISSSGTQTLLSIGLSNPRALTFDSSGNLYVTSFYGNQVHKYNPTSGTITLIAGSGFIGSDGGGGFSGDGGLATAARLNAPVGVAVDAQGNVFVCDMRNNRVRMIDSATGIIQTVIGNGDSSYNGDDIAAHNASVRNPYGLMLTPNGDFYVVDYGNGRIRKIAAATNAGSVAVGQSVIRTFDFYFRSSTTVGSFKILTGGAPSRDFQIYETGTNCAAGVTYPADASCRVNVTFSPLAAGPRKGAVVLYGSTGAAVSTAFITGTGVAPAVAFNPVVTVVAGTGGICSSSTGANCGDGGAATSATFRDPVSVAVDNAGNLLVTDYGSNRVRRVDASTGIILTVAGTGAFSSTGDGGLATAATLYNPSGVAFDGAGNYFISDVDDASPFYSRIRRVDAGTGIITTYAGVGTRCSSNTAACGDGSAATSANLWLPRGLAVDGEGNLFLADQHMNRIRKVSAATGIISNVAGKSGGSGGFSGDAGQAASALLQLPAGVARDSAGNLYIADMNNHRVRKVTYATGIITTVAGASTAGSSGDGAAATSAQLYCPTAVAVDAAGDIFIADSGNGRVRMVDASTGYISTLVSGLSNPSGLAVDAAGNLYVVDENHYRVLKVSFPAPSLSFAATNLLATSAAQDVTVRNAGNASLNIASIAVPTNFTLGGANTTCYTSSVTLASGANCVLGVVFNPHAAGALSGSIVLTDDALNQAAATQSIPVSGTGAQVATRLAFGSSIPSSLISGNNLGTLTVKVEDTTGGVLAASTAAVTLTLSGPAGFTTKTSTQNAASGVASFDLSAYSLTIGGSYSITATSGSLTSASATVAVLLTPTLKLTCTEATYDGAAHSCTGSAVGTDGVTAVSGSWGFSPSSVTAAGSYPVTGTFTSTDSLYMGGTAAGTLKINTASPTLQLTCTEVTYDGAAHSCTGSATGLGGVAVSGSWSFSPSSVTAAGSYPVTGTFTSTDSNYAGGTANGTLKINEAVKTAQTIQFTAPASPVTYGVGTVALSATASSGLAVTFSVLSGPATVSGSALTITGAGTVVIAANQAGNSTYAAAAQATQSIVVNKAALQVKADAKSMTAGASVPSLTYTISGYVGSDSAAVVSGAAALSTTATSSSAAGSYAIKVAQGTLAATNYTFTPANGTLTVTAASTIKLTVSTALTKLDSGQFQAVLTITNSGTATASAVALTSAKLGGIAGTPLPTGLTIAAGSSATATIVFPVTAGTSGAAAVLSYAGSYTGGSFSSASRVTLP
jgi:sugar lactone lactonase YvrE